MKMMSTASAAVSAIHYWFSWIVISLLSLILCASVQAEAAPTHTLTLEGPTILTTLPPRCTITSDSGEKRKDDETEGGEIRKQAFELKPAPGGRAQCESFKELRLAPVEGSRFRFWPPAPEVVEDMFRSTSVASVSGHSPGASTATEGQSENADEQPSQALIALCERNRFGRSMCGLQDRAGQLLVPFKFDEARPNPDSDLQAVRFDNRWGYYSIGQQRLIVVPQFIKVGDFTQGSAFVETSDNPTRTWLIDENGNRIKELPVGARISGEYEDGLSLLRFDQRFGYIDERGNVVISAQFVNATPFKDGLAFVQYNEEPDQYALIDREGEGLLFFQLPDTRMLPLGQQQYLALSACNSRTGCLARCLSLGAKESPKVQALISDTPVVLEVSCLAEDDQQESSD